MTGRIACVERRRAHAGHADNSRRSSGDYCTAYDRTSFCPSGAGVALRFSTEVAWRWQRRDLAGKVYDHRIRGELRMQSLDFTHVHESASSRSLE
jgi:hypothetical protein